MTSITTTTYSNTRTEATSPKSLLGTIVDTLFAVNLREKLDAQTSGDKSDAAYTFGL